MTKVRLTKSLIDRVNVNGEPWLTDDDLEREFDAQVTHTVDVNGHYHFHYTVDIGDSRTVGAEESDIIPVEFGRKKLAETLRREIGYIRLFRMPFNPIRRYLISRKCKKLIPMIDKLFMGKMTDPDEIEALVNAVFSIEKG